MSELHVLNVGEGDTRLSFDKDKPEERERAARIVKDMLRLGYAISVQVDLGDGQTEYRRATDFDPNTCEYLIEEPASRKQRRATRMRRSRHIPADRATAIATARPAGGCAREAW